jgi:predicted RNase H-like HicB family nuclease
VSPVPAYSLARVTDIFWIPRMDSYFALLHPPEDQSSWGVTFPDLPGCVSGGDNFEDAVQAAREALSGHLAALRADGDPVLRPRTWADLSADPETDRDGAFVQLITPRRVPAERVRINITIDKGLLRVADEAAEAEGMNRSAFIERALEAATGG